jgi:polar amino acid transport system substrate-binding protein
MTGVETAVRSASMPIKFWLSLFCLATLTLACLRAESPSSGPTLSVGMELAYPPFETTDKDGKPAGLSVELAFALGHYLHRPVRILNMPYAELIPALKTGRIDAIISSMTITQERSRLIDFSDPYCRSGLAILLQKNSNLNAIDDLDQDGVKVVVKAGTSGDNYAQSHLQKATLTQLPSTDACALKVVQGSADAFIYDQLSIINYHAKYPDKTRINLQAFVEEPWGIGVAKGNEDFRLQVNAFLADFRARGGFTQFGNKYFSKEEQIFKDQGLPFYF